jgi:AcrR family transcriptional regulator
MARRSEHSPEQIKTMLLDAAELVVNEQGFSALKARSIAKDIGYTVGSLYMVFNNMPDLIMQLHARTLDAIVLHLQQSPFNESEARMESLAFAYMNYGVQHFNRWRFIFDDRLLADAEIPDWYQNKIDKLTHQFELCLASLKPELDPLEIKHNAFALFAGIQGICALSIKPNLDKDEFEKVEATIITLVRHFMQGIKIQS